MYSVLFYSFYLTLLSGQLSALFKDSGINIYLFDIASIFFNFVFIGNLILRKSKLFIPKFHILLFTFSLLGLASLLLNSTIYSLSLLSAVGYLVRFTSYVINSLAIYNLILLGKLTREQVIKTIINGGIFLVLGGFVQLLLLPDFETLDPSLGWDPHKNRLASTFFDPNFLGCYLVLSFLLLLSPLLGQKEAFYPKVQNILYFVILSTGIFLTFSRSSWLMLAVVFVSYGIFRNFKYIFLGLSLMFLAYYMVPRVQTRITGTTDPADSAQFRYSSWQSSVEIIKLSPIVGIGYNATRDVSKQVGLITIDDLDKHHVAGSDSSILFILMTTGFLGLALFGWAVITVLIAAPTGLKTFYLTAIAALVANSQFINSLFYPQILIIWLIVGSFSSLAYRKP